MIPALAGVTAQTLRAAAAYVRQNGWTTGTEIDGKGQVCAVGALHYSMVSDSSRSLSAEQLQRYYDAAVAVWPLLPAPFSDPPRHADAIKDMSDRKFMRLYTEGRLIAFNDQVCKGGEDLALLFEQTAEKLETDL